MHLLFLLLGVLLATVQSYGLQVQMTDDGPLNLVHDQAEQIERLQLNISDLWTNFNELKTALIQNLNHLRVHQTELEETVHRLEHKHDDNMGSRGSHTDDHHHSGEHHSHSDDSHSHGGDSHSHSGDSHSHGGDSHSHGADSHSHGGDSHSHSDTDHHHHSGEHHSHSGEQHSHGDDHSHGGESHSHSGETHSHGADSHSHGGESHSHSDEHHSHGDNHHHESRSHSHANEATSSGHGNHPAHQGDSHEKEDLQQTRQTAIVEPLVVATSTQQHYHHHNRQQPQTGNLSPLQLINDTHFNHPHHHHKHHHSNTRNDRNRTVITPKFSEYTLYNFAVCNVLPNRAIPADQQQEVIGRINLWQKKTGGPLSIHVRLQGFDMGDHHHHGDQQSVQKEEDNETPVTISHKHGMHIHSLGDLSNGCQSTGPHYSPKNVNHGGPNDLTRHVGDLGNIECDDQGNVNIKFNNEIASLSGQYSIIGKSIAIHAKTDDYGLGGDEESLKTGNAGTRIACCLIEKVEKLPIRTYKVINLATHYQNR